MVGIVPAAGRPELGAASVPAAGMEAVGTEEHWAEEVDTAVGSFVLGEQVEQVEQVEQEADTVLEVAGTVLEAAGTASVAVVDTALVAVVGIVPEVVAGTVLGRDIGPEAAGTVLGRTDLVPDSLLQRSWTHLR